MTSSRRSSKEPDVSPESPFAPVVAAARAIVRGLAASVPQADPGEDAAFLRGWIEGMVGVILLASLTALTDEERKLAEDWAAREHLRASDNIVRRRPKPPWLDGLPKEPAPPCPCGGAGCIFCAGGTS